MATRMVVTGLDDNGAGQFVRDGMVQDNALGEKEKIALLWGFDERVSRDASNFLEREDAFARLSNPEAPPPQALWGVTELAPGGEIALHSTSTVDLIVALEGEVTCRLETGTSIILKAGETMVQRGTVHAWLNEGVKPCRWMFVALADRTGG